MTRKIDIPLLLAVLCLVAIGLVFVYSASCYNAQITYGNKYFYVVKQAIGAALGAICMLAASRVSVDVIKKLWLAGVIVSVVLLLLVFVPGVGIENYGAKRWIGFGGFSLQPSEIAKFAFVLFCAKFQSDCDMSKIGNCLVVVGVGVLFCGLIIVEPNMSITMCMAALMVIMLFLGGVQWKRFLLLLLPVVAAVPVLIFIEPYRLQRLVAFLDPWASPKDEGYQLIQSLYALGSGGFFGVGIFNSRQKYRFLPFAESDFVLAVIGEETGLFGCAIVFALYLVVIVRGVRIAANCDDKFKCFLAGGISAVIAVQSILNFAVVTGSIPPTGLPLPFVSYGGTSLVVFMTATGVLLNLSSKIKEKSEGKPWIT